MAVFGCIADDFTGASDAASFLKKGGLKTVKIEDYLIEYNIETGIIILKAGNAGGFNLIELMRQYMPLQNINITRLKVKKDDFCR